MFESVISQLKTIIAKQKDEEDSRERGERSLEKLRAMKTEDGTTELVDVIRNSDVEGLLRHVEKHGSSTLTSLTNAVGPDVEKTRKAQREDRDAFWASAAVPFTDKQESALADLPTPELKAYIQARTRAGIVFDPEFRPAQDTDTSFVGGLPVVGPGLEWPRAKGTGRPLTFLGQIDVSDLPEFPLRGHFPEYGALVFFAPGDNRDDGGTLVQHISMENAQEIPLPDDAAPYHSTFKNVRAKTGDGQIGWLHEQGLGLQPYSILPKWPLIPRLAAFAPQGNDFYDSDIPVPDDLLAQHNGDVQEYCQAMGKVLNGIGGNSPRQRAELVAGFPHIWGAVADITQRFLPLIDACEAALGQDVPEDIATLRSEVTKWHARANEFELDALVSDEDRAAFHNLLKLMSSEEGIPLPSGKTLIGATALNDPRAIKEFLYQIQTHWLLSSLCSDPSTIAPDVRSATTERLTSEFPSKGYIQSLGHTHDVSGEEFATESVLLMQFPWSYITDTTGVYGFSGLRFWMDYEDFKSREYQRVLCSH